MLNRILHLCQKLSGEIQENTFRRHRKNAEKYLKTISSNSFTPLSGRVLVDATWDNPNYWLRYSLLRAALNLSAAEEVGIIGRFRRQEQLGTLKRLGIGRYLDLLKEHDFNEGNELLARHLVQQTTTQEDILAWELPSEFPPDFLYDQILKMQRGPFVNFNDENFSNHTLSYLNQISVFERIIEEEKPSLVIASHVIGMYAPLVWAALRKGVKVVVPFGDAGMLRFWLLSDTAEIRDFMDRPKYGDLQKLGDQQRQAFLAAGAEAIHARMSGLTTNLGAMFAYSKRSTEITKPDICSRFSWDPHKPIIGVYASNWFDFPHGLGMKHFTDFYDWATATLRCASATGKFNWIFKAHPVDAWYGGVSLGDLINLDGLPHIKLAPVDWNGAAMLKALDAFVTYHGTVGIEATACGKPVLVADVGWYHDWGFVKVPESRQHYLEALTQRWWEEMDIEENSRLAKIFAGWYWGKPSWQGRFLLEDDSEQWEIYKKIPALLKTNAGVIARETEIIREWFLSEYPHYHTYKMMMQYLDTQ
jgi:hypothetical protein